MTILKLLSKIISHMKSEEFVIDDKISFLYIVGFLISKFLSCLRFIIKFKTLKLGFIGKKSIVLATNHIKIEKNLLECSPED